jgi:hypothetical protein
VSYTHSIASDFQYHVQYMLNASFHKVVEQSPDSLFASHWLKCPVRGIFALGYVQLLPRLFQPGPITGPVTEEKLQPEGLLVPGSSTCGVLYRHGPVPSIPGLHVLTVTDYNSPEIAHLAQCTESISNVNCTFFTLSKLSGGALRDCGLSADWRLADAPEMR